MARIAAGPPLYAVTRFGRIAPPTLGCNPALTPRAPASRGGLPAPRRYRRTEPPKRRSASWTTRACSCSTTLSVSVAEGSRYVTCSAMLL